MWSSLLPVGKRRRLVPAHQHPALVRLWKEKSNQERCVLPRHGDTCADVQGKQRNTRQRQMTYFVGVGRRWQGLARVIMWKPVKVKLWRTQGRGASIMDVSARGLSFLKDSGRQNIGMFMSGCDNILILKVDDQPPKPREATATPGTLCQSTRARSHPEVLMLWATLTGRNGWLRSCVYCGVTSLWRQQTCPPAWRSDHRHARCYPQSQATADKTELLRQAPEPLVPCALLNCGLGPFGFLPSSTIQNGRSLDLGHTVPAAGHLDNVPQTLRRRPTRGTTLRRGDEVKVRFRSCYVSS